MGLRRFTSKVSAVVKSPVALVKATVTGDKAAAKVVLTQTIAAPVNIVKAGAGDKLVQAGSNAVSAFSVLGKAGLNPLTNIKRDLGNWNDPKQLFKDQFRDGRTIGHAAENVMVNLNPADSALKKFDQKGIEAGGIGKILGRTGEKARQNPIATTAIVYGAVVAAGSSAAKGVLSGGKAYAGYAGKAVSVAKTANSVLNKPSPKPGATSSGADGYQEPAPKKEVPKSVMAGVGLLILKLLIF